MTFSLKIVTPEDRAAQDREALRDRAIAECHRRITAAASDHTQMNMASAAAAGLLSADDMAAYRAALSWVAHMRAAWRAMVERGDDPADDAQWPIIPAEALALARRF